MMTAKELVIKIQELINHGMPEDVIITAFDADLNEVTPVTGLLYDNQTLELCTDDNS